MVAVPGAFEQLRRLATGEGDVFDYMLTWTWDRVPHAAHKVRPHRGRHGYVRRALAGRVARRDGGG